MNRLCQFQMSALCVRYAGVVRAGRVFFVFTGYITSAAATSMATCSLVRQSSGVRSGSAVEWSGRHQGSGF
jgi:hypothetical protein